MLLRSILRARPPAAAVQGAYWLSFVWPLLHYRSFERVTGQKTDDWLVRTTGGLGTAVAATLLVAATRGDATRAETAVLGIGAAAAVTTADVRYVLTRRISPIYLVDALAHVLILCLWARDLSHPRAAKPDASLA